MRIQLPKNVSHACRIITVLTNTVNQREARIAELEEELESQIKETTTWLRRYDKSVSEQLEAIKERDKYKAHYDLSIEKDYPKKKFPRQHTKALKESK